MTSTNPLPHFPIQSQPVASGISHQKKAPSELYFSAAKVDHCRHELLELHASGAKHGKHREQQAPPTSASAHGHEIHKRKGIEAFLFGHVHEALHFFHIEHHHDNTIRIKKITTVSAHGIEEHKERRRISVLLDKGFDTAHKNVDKSQ